jgi:DNA-binding NtrC family response regulator
MAKEYPGCAEVESGYDAGLRSAGAVPSKRHSSVLIVDDEAELARRYERALRAHGYAVEMASNRETAMRLVSEGKFDILVGDMDGREAGSCETLVSIHSQRRDLAVVLLASGLGFSSARAAVACGAYRYLLKPVSEERLLAAVVETIREKTRQVQ